MTDDCRKRLTEFLGECWHDETFDEEKGCNRCSCGMRFSEHKQLIGHIKNDNETRLRTFDTEADMMALYRRLHETGKWGAWLSFVYPEFGSDCGLGKAQSHFAGFDPWLFCLSGEGYEERCQMVDEFLEEHYE